LIEEFKTLDNLIKNADKISNKRISQKVIEHKNEAILSRELVKINSSVPLEFGVDDLKMSEPDNEKLFEIYKELEFRNLLKNFASNNKAKTNYKIINSQKELEDLILEIKKQGMFAFDFETNSPDPHLAIPVGLAFSFKENSSCYLSLASMDYSPEGSLQLEKAFKLLKSIFEDASLKKIGQNIKYEYIILDRYGIHLKGIYFDTMIASYLLNPSKANHNLDDISLEYLGHKMVSYSELVTKNSKKAIPITQVPLKELADYACEDADITFRLQSILRKKMDEENLWDLYEKIELPLVKVLATIESNGILLDEKKLKKLSKDLTLLIEELKNKIITLAGVEFNLNSPKQLSEVLFEKLKLPIIKKTKTGASTDVEVLERLSEMHELPQLLLKYRELSKIQSTYTDKLCSLINPTTGKLHTSFNQTVTQTGRLSSSNPNLQNIPIRSDLGKRIREAFIPSKKSNIFLSADYSQIELRVLAHLSQDKALKKAFMDNLDVHSYTAGLVYDVDIKDVTPQMRSNAKTVNFSVIYGVSPYGLARDMHIDIKEAKDFLDN
jgi:DNA polymerase-1